jgi:DNA repair exonuclease SbcCD ATPase subunit
MINMHSLLAILTHPGKETKDTEAVRLEIVEERLKSLQVKTTDDSTSCVDFNKPLSYRNSSIVSNQDKGKGPALPRHRPLPSLISSSTPPLQPSLQPSLSALVSSKLSTTRLPKGGPEVGPIQANSTVPPTNISVNQEAALKELNTKQLDLFETLDPALKRLPEDPEEDPRPKSKKAKLSHDGGRMPLFGDYTQEELREVIRAHRSKAFKIDELLWRIDRRERERLEAKVKALESDLAAEKSHIHVLQQQVTEEGEKLKKEKKEKEKAEEDLATEKNRNQELQQQAEKEKEQKERVMLLLERAEGDLAAETDRVKEAQNEIDREKTTPTEELATVKRKFEELIEGTVSWHETIYEYIMDHTHPLDYFFIQNMFKEIALSTIRSQCLKWREMEEDRRPTKKHRGVREIPVPDILIRIGDDGEVLEDEDEEMDVEE